ncbi:hypothetical protein N9373_01815 [Flavobacteriaceae bacterium]|nr:hypothetical protein [Flavobacteriaceae bacterium]
MLILFTCGESNQFQRNEIIYNNDFESGDFNAIDGAQIMTFNNTTVLGSYNNDGFALNLNNIGPHDYIYISFDLYIHDSWDGNFNNFDPDQPDTWFIELISDFDSGGGTPFNVWKTSFSNSVCSPTYCLRQSFPDVYPFENLPREGSSRLLPGLCSLDSELDGTTMYTIEQGFEHTGNALLLRFYDQLYQPNVADQRCDESWSLDNLKVRVFTL